ncbi:MAG: ACP S-malonyltransferase [Burkholderiales bacterium]
MSLAFLFPGQGSQSVGMMAAYAQSPAIQPAFEVASRALNLDLWNLVAQGPAEELGRTVNTQPVMLVAGYAIYQAWKSAGGRTPAFMAGHSLGEYTAWVCAGAVEFADAAPFVRARARIMQDAVPEGTGGIAALLGAELKDVLEVCAQASSVGVVEPANLNAPGQIVIAGHRNAVEKAMELAKTRGAKRAVMLPMSAPSHCSLMKGASEEIGALLQKLAIRSPSVSVVCNADVAINTEPAAIKSALTRQLYSPVRWIETIELLSKQGVDTFVECGPGQVLSGLVKRIVPQAKILALKDYATIEQLAKEYPA